MENEEQNDFRLEGTGFAYTLSLINGKYKMPILYCLSKREVVRYNEMKRSESVLFWEMQLPDCVCKREVESLRFRRKKQCLNLCTNNKCI